jgi:polyisoprenyl-phosphate glycosyltransferase
MTNIDPSSQIEGGSIGLSIVIPCYDEQTVLPLLRQRLVGQLEKLGIAWEVIFVDDGSADSTFESLARMHAEDARLKVISLSRNFGHQAAICAGLSCAVGQAVGVMDADLQDPPEILALCLQKLDEGAEVVYAVRRKRKEGLLKRSAYALFYRGLRHVAEVEIPLDAGDFCVMDRRVAQILRDMPERNVFLRGMRAWTGFRQVGLEYDREARAAGESKYSYRKLVRLAVDGVFAFSYFPLRLAVYLGLFTTAMAVAAIVYLILWRIIGFRVLGHTGAELPGWTGVMCAILFYGGLQLIMLGLVGEYIGRIFTEVKQRPLWIARKFLGTKPVRTSPDALINKRGL